MHTPTARKGTTSRARLPRLTETPVGGGSASERGERGSHSDLDCVTRALMARLSGGVSAHVFIEAWTDWAFHLSESPGRQLELIEQAQQSVLMLLAHAAGADPESPQPFSPKPFDNRFTHPCWQKPPFPMWQQGFLATRDWWDHATDHLRGMCPKDADRARFMAQQALDTVSSSNFPAATVAAMISGLSAATVAADGRNLTEGAVHFARDVIKTLTQIHEPAPEGFRIGQVLTTAGRGAGNLCFPNVNQTDPERTLEWPIPA
jgi:polyhydroxyalkanoate synthase